MANEWERFNQTFFNTLESGIEKLPQDERKELYTYLPQDAAKKILSTNFLERRLKITAITRKLSVVRHLIEME